MNRSIWLVTAALAVAIATAIAVALLPPTAKATYETPPVARASPSQAVCIEWTHTAELQFFRHNNTRIDDPRETTVTVVSGSATGPTNQHSSPTRTTA